MGNDSKPPRVPRPTYRKSPLHIETCDVLREQRVKAKLSQVAVSALMGRADPFCNRIEMGGRLLNCIEFMHYCRVIQTSAAFVAAEAEQRLAMKNQPVKPGDVKSAEVKSAEPVKPKPKKRRRAK